MGTFKIEGGKSLKGEITPQGAKNAVGVLTKVCSIFIACGP